MISTYCYYQGEFSRSLVCSTNWSTTQLESCNKKQKLEKRVKTHTNILVNKYTSESYVGEKLICVYWCCVSTKGLFGSKQLSVFSKSHFLILWAQISCTYKNRKLADMSAIPPPSHTSRDRAPPLRLRTCLRSLYFYDFSLHYYW